MTPEFRGAGVHEASRKRVDRLLHHYRAAAHADEEKARGGRGQPGSRPGAGVII